MQTLLLRSLGEGARPRIEADGTDRQTVPRGHGVTLGCGPPRPGHLNKLFAPYARPVPDDDSHDDSAKATNGGSASYGRPTEPPATRLVLVRHGESQVTVDRVIGGQRTCSGLSELGRLQAERLRDRLAGTRELDDAVFISSTFARAVETAEIIQPGLGDPKLHIEAGFGEHDPGPELDGISFDEYVTRFGSPNWGDPHFEVFPGGGESIARFHLRVGATLSRTLAEHDGKLIVVACHGGVVDAVFRLLLKMAPTGIFDLWTLNTSLTEFKRTSPSDADQQRWRLVRYNDTAHLAGLPDATPPTP